MTQNLPCNTCSDRKCEKAGKTTYACKLIDKALGTGIAWPKKKTYSVDMQTIEESSNPLNKFQRDVFRTIRNSSKEKNKQADAKQVLEETMTEVLSEKEKQIIVWYFLENQKQAKIAKDLGVSQPRINTLKDRALKKLKAALPETLYKFVLKKVDEQEAIEE